MKIWFTSRNIYDREYNISSWENYIKWSRLEQLEELVSLDGSLNDLTFEPDFENEIEEIVLEETKVTQFYKSIQYVEAKSKDLDYYNLLAVVQNPLSNKQSQLERDFEFIGYDLIEINGDISALVNCGGFDETFLPKEQNKFGLISDYSRAKEVEEVLRINNPNEHHADCYLYEIWRHKFKGRNSFNKSFCVELECKIGSALESFIEKEIKGFWCDGIIHRRVPKKYVNDNKEITTKAYLGKDGQSEYEMKLILGSKSLSRFSKGTNMSDCIPDAKEENWIQIVPDRKKLIIKLK